MSVFAYAGFGPDGRRRRGWVEAENVKAARAALAGQGILTVRVAPAALPSRLRTAERAALYRGVGVLLQSAFPVERALGLLMTESAPAARAYGFLAGLRDRVRDGESLAAALAAMDRGLPAFERAATQAAERSGIQGEMLVRLAEYLEAQRAVGERVRAALVYPAFVLCAGLGLASLMLFVVVPRALELLARAHGEAPPLALWIVGAGRAALTFLLGAAAAAGVAALLLRGRIRRSPRASAALERALWRLPVAGPIRARLWSLRFSRTLGLLLQAGSTAVDALPLAGQSTGSAWLAALAAAEAERVRHGASLSAAVAALSPLAPSLLEWVRLGESAGNLQSMLDQAARRCQQDYEQRLARAVGLLEPALILLVGLVVLTVALTVVAPLLQIARRAAGG
jgi:general secretion pathway protein F